MENIDRYTYLIDCLKGQRYLERAWLLSLFGILLDNTDHREKTLMFVEDKNLYVKVSSGENYIQVKDYIFGLPIYSKDEIIILSPGVLHCNKEVITTTVGLAVLNGLLIEYPYQDTEAYINKPLTPSSINAVGYRKLVADKVPVTQHLKLENAISMLNVLATVGVPAATRRSISINPEMSKIKNQRIEENKSNLSDPLVIAQIQAELSEIDRQYLLGDDSQDFLISRKAKTSRLKILGLAGAEQDLVDENKINVISRSLNEGWQAEDMPSLANSIRAGSISRGQDTAQGGYKVKLIDRILQNYVIDKTVECGTQHGKLTLITEDNYKDYINYYALKIKDDHLTSENISKHIGKQLLIRSPQYCTADATNICYKCLGDDVVNVGIGLSSQMTAVISTFTALFLALAHATQLSIQEYDFKQRIS